MKKITKHPHHLLLRFSDSLLKDGDTIEAHTDVIDREGAVWFGKMGSTVSQNHVEIFHQQIQSNIPTYVYLVKGNRRKSTAYRARLVLASKTLPEGEAHLVPAYYDELDIPKYVKFWVKLSKIVESEFSELKTMQAISSAYPISETLVKSSSGHFIIRESTLLSA